MAANENGKPIDFCTLGMFIIDDIYPPKNAPDRTPKTNIIGGAGTYSAIGARLLSPPPRSNSVGWIIDEGTDFPPELGSTIASWQTSVLIRPRDALTTRGWNGYAANEHRAFRYLTEKKRLTADDLTPDLLRAKSFHLICSPTRCVELTSRILDRRRAAELERSVVIWEPVPDLCTPEELNNTYKALAHVDVISPNHEELGALFGFSHELDVDKAAIEKQTNKLLARGIGPTKDGAVVVRAGKEGCFVANLDTRKWLPAYHKDPTKVIDPTGGGNGFLGGLAVGLVRCDGEIVEAARWGSVAASFCIEQVGMPTLTTVVATATCTDELWNDESVTDRLTEYRDRTS
ncbi:hypothetical protein LTR37_012331 [Vermiconidia calcicola]|uniref:Uncharacterized protein n=1 Tax=Vermiconidia calcicola TaxID=1690605 RepID=A0ACC3MZR6_9PEZI|nr:hypothetical protein LTR37_012331 [Vermiconidia calcicola]